MGTLRYHLQPTKEGMLQRLQPKEERQYNSTSLVQHHNVLAGIVRVPALYNGYVWGITQ